MNKLYIPISNNTINDSTREKYCEHFRNLKADRLFITFISEEYSIHGIEALKENTAFFKERGFEVGVWINGFGTSPSVAKNAPEELKRSAKITSIKGVSQGAFCPTDKGFMKIYLELVKAVASVGPDMIMIDDDLCLSVRPGIGCFCENHKKMIWQNAGEIFEDFEQKIFTGKPSRYRDAWYKAVGDSLRDFCKAVRQAIDSVDATIRAGFCSGYTSWDMEGADALELSLILAGDTEPFVRFSGAPYWVMRDKVRFPGQRMAEIIGFVRAQEKLTRGKISDVFHEGDVYPRPRYRVPANLLECYDLALKACGGIHSFKYIEDYCALPGMEDGYIDRHIKNIPLYDFIEEKFSKKSCDGIYVYENLKTIQDRELPGEFIGEKPIMHKSIGTASGFLGIHCLPVTYEPNDEYAIAFGENAKHIEKLPKKLIVDISAAKILVKRGFDLGLFDCIKAEEPITEVYGGNEYSLWSAAKDSGYYNCTINKSAKIMSYYKSENTNYPSAYTYNNGKTEFLVFTFDAGETLKNASTLLSYIKQDIITDFMPNLPHIKKHPEVYEVYKKGENDCALLFVNIFEDSMFDFEIQLDDIYGKMEIMGANGVLKGDKIAVTSEIPPYGAFAVYLEK